MTLENQKTGDKAAAGVLEDPFSPEPDPQFYFAFDAFEKRLAMLTSLVAGTDVIVLVIGETGGSKTTLLNQYLLGTNVSWKACHIRYSPTADAERSRPAGKDHGFAAYILQDSTDPVIFVDDAHRLDRSRLRFLLKEALVPGSSQKVKRLVLFGTPDLYTAVSAVSASFPTDTAVHKIYLTGLTREETAAYLQHRLAIAGYTGDSPFKKAVVKKIYQTTGGNPGAINEAARQLLSKADGGRATAPGFFQKLNNASSKKIAWMIAGILVVLLAALWLYPKDNQPGSKLSVRKPAARVFRAKIGSDKNTARRTIRVKIPPVRIPAESKPPPAVTSKPVPAPPVVVRVEKPEPAVVAVRPKRTAVPSSPPSSSAIKSSAVGELQREKWLLSQNPAHYTIQILGVRSERSLLDFIRENQLEKQKELSCYRGTYKGRDWYRLLYGVFTTRQAARLTAQGLPAPIRRASPWVRRLSSVQRDIRQF